MSLENAAKRSQEKAANIDDLIAEARRDQEEKVPTKRFNVEIPEELHTTIKLQATREARSMKDIFLDAMEMYLSRR
jgi:predicted HicB family RNase H-like nuclease